MKAKIEYIAEKIKGIVTMMVNTLAISVGNSRFGEQFAVQ